MGFTSRPLLFLHKDTTSIAVLSFRSSHHVTFDHHKQADGKHNGGDHAAGDRVEVGGFVFAPVSVDQSDL